jgi:hypothetical protein
MPSDRLDGWKEISQYLRRNVRTCQRWEKEHGLPLYRLSQNLKRAKVYTFKSELEGWLKAKTNNNHPSNNSVSRKKTRPLWPVLLAFFLAVTAAGLWYFVIRDTARNPVNWEIRGQRIVFLDEDNQILWGVDIESSHNMQMYYTDEEEPYIRLEKYKRCRIAISDIRNNGNKYVLLANRHDDPSLTQVILFNNKGKRIWSKEPELKQRYPEESFKKGYFPIDLMFNDIDGDGRKESLILMIHHKRFPSIFMICDRKGREKFRYEHSGNLQFINVSELGGKGKHIFLGGTNNLLGGEAVLAVLDCGRLKSGTGPPYDIQPEFDHPDMRPGRYVPIDPVPSAQRYYVRFKKNRLSDLQGILWQSVISAFGDNDSCTVEFNNKLEGIEPIHFQFDRYFSLIGVVPCGELKRSYAAMLKKGLVEQSLPEFLQSLRQDVLFWNGRGWTSTPTDLLQSP